MLERNAFLQAFSEAFQCSSEGTRIFFAPGRVNLIGEHTDFSGGYVFPAALTFGTWAVVKPRRDGLFRLASTGFETHTEFSVKDAVFHPEDSWANYPKGVIREFQRQGVPLFGCDMLFHGNIPKAAGLSSSASIELVTGIALNSIENTGVVQIDLVKWAQKAENEFVGVHCGIMDQFAVGMGKADHAILLKCDTLDYRYVPLATKDYRWVITNSNKPRSLTVSKYNERRKEAEAGFRLIQPHLPSVSCLGDVGAGEWAEVRRYVENRSIAKRLEHIVTENARTLASTRALETGDLQAFGRYMLASHESLRDLYEVTGFELDSLHAEARAVEGCLGTRMTGAGFGGCIVSLVSEDALADFQKQVAFGYRAKTGLTPTSYVCTIGDGAREVTEEI